MIVLNLVEIRILKKFSALLLQYCSNKIRLEIQSRTFLGKSNLNVIRSLPLKLFFASADH